jgi:outer membrane biosynthesis protein TonB
LRDVRALGGPLLLEQAAVEAAKRLRVKPALLNGSPVEAEITVRVVFRPDK